jgi:hypothetical protein
MRLLTPDITPMPKLVSSFGNKKHADGKIYLLIMRECDAIRAKENKL